MNMLSSIDVPVEVAAPRTLSRPRWRRRVALLMPLVLIGVAGAKLIDRPDASAAVATPPHVTVAAPLVRQITESQEQVGRFSASRTVDVRPGIAGEVTAVHVLEGEIVSKGQPLFTVGATDMRAPISGRVALRHVEGGSRVVAGRVLATIEALDPIRFTFDAPARAPTGPALVEVRTESEASHRWAGRFEPTLASVGRAILPNRDYALRPGMAGRIRLATTGRHPALLVPADAVQGGKSVLVLDPQDVVVERPVTLGPVVEGLRVVRTGLNAGDRIVIQGAAVALPGFKVAPHAGQIEIADGAALPRR